MRQYHIGFLKDYSDLERVIVQARRDVDFLSCEIWQYMGVREVTKKKLYDGRWGLLAAINQMFGTSFTKIRID